MSRDGKTSRRLVRLLAELGPRYEQWVQSQAPSGEVTFARSRLLAVLHEEGPCPMRRLSERLGITPRSVTNLVDALEREGLARRVAAENDRRVYMIHATATGAKIGCAMSESHEGAVAQLFERMSSAEQAALLKLLQTLGDLLQP